MRAISFLSRLDGISTVSWAAMMPFRIRVRKSAMGSVIDMMRLPARLRHAGDEAVVRELAQAHAAQAELAVHGARTAATPTTRLRARHVLRRAVCRDFLGGLSHSRSSLLEEVRLRSDDRGGAVRLLPYTATGSPERMLSYCLGRPSRAKGRPSASRSVNASSLLLAVVVNATSRPRT